MYTSLSFCKNTYLRLSKSGIKGHNLVFQWVQTGCFKGEKCFELCTNSTSYFLTSTTLWFTCICQISSLVIWLVSSRDPIPTPQLFKGIFLLWDINQQASPPFQCRGGSLTSTHSGLIKEYLKFLQTLFYVPSCFLPTSFACITSFDLRWYDPFFMWYNVFMDPNVTPVNLFTLWSSLAQPSEASKGLSKGLIRLGFQDPLPHPLMLWSVGESVKVSERAL